jgi:hypothetical protein
MHRLFGNFCVCKRNYTVLHQNWPQTWHSSVWGNRISQSFFRVSTCLLSPWIFHVFAIWVGVSTMLRNSKVLHFIDLFCGTVILRQRCNMLDITDVYWDYFHRHWLTKHDVSKADCLRLQVQEVLGQRIGPIFTGQEFQSEFLDFLTLEIGTDILSRNVDKG